MMGKAQELIIIGDRVLISPDLNEGRTDSGLYLPQGLAEKEKVRSGYIIKTGPGYIMPRTDSSEPWLDSKNEPQYIPLQVQEGDLAIFLSREAVEIEFEKKKYLIAPQSSILAVVRDNFGPVES